MYKKNSNTKTEEKTENTSKPAPKMEAKSNHSIKHMIEKPKAKDCEDENIEQQQEPIDDKLHTLKCEPEVKQLIRNEDHTDENIMGLKTDGEDLYDKEVEKDISKLPSIKEGEIKDETKNNVYNEKAEYHKQEQKIDLNAVYVENSIGLVKRLPDRKCYHHKGGYNSISNGFLRYNIHKTDDFKNLLPAREQKIADSEIYGKQNQKVAYKQSYRDKYLNNRVVKKRAINTLTNNLSYDEAIGFKILDSYNAFNGFQKTNIDKFIDKKNDEVNNYHNVSNMGKDSFNSGFGQGGQQRWNKQSKLRNSTHLYEPINKNKPIHTIDLDAILHNFEINTPAPQILDESQEDDNLYMKKMEQDDDLQEIQTGFAMYKNNPMEQELNDLNINLNYKKHSAIM